MEFLENTDMTESLTFEKINEFRCLEAVLCTKNDWTSEIRLRIIEIIRASFALYKFLRTKLFSKKAKARLYTTVVRPTLRT